MKTAYKFRLYPNRQQEGITRSYEDQPKTTIGVDLGITHAAVTSDESTYGFGLRPK
jgi:transposase